MKPSQMHIQHNFQVKARLLIPQHLHQYWHLCSPFSFPLLNQLLLITFLTYQFYLVSSFLLLLFLSLLDLNVPHFNIRKGCHHHQFNRLRLGHRILHLWHRCSNQLILLYHVLLQLWLLDQWQFLISLPPSIFILLKITILLLLTLLQIYLFLPHLLKLNQVAIFI